MSLYISIASTNRHLGAISSKAKTLKLSVQKDLYPARGKTAETDEERAITVFQHSNELWDYILSLEPLVDMSQRSKKGSLMEPSHLDVVTLGYPEPGTK